MIKQLAWNTFKNTGNIDTYLELIEVENIDNLIEILKHKALLHDSRTQEISNEVEYDY